MPRNNLSDQRSVNSSGEMTFFEHLDALRPHLLRSAGVFVVLMILAFISKKLIINDILFGPLNEGFPTNRLLVWLSSVVNSGETNRFPPEIVNTTMAGQFNLHLKISMMTALVLSTPYILWELWRFVKPALTPSELQSCRMFVTWTSCSFFTGIAFGYLIISPFSIRFLSQYNISERVTNMIDVNSYLSTVADVTLACAVVFELPLLVYFLTRAGILSAAFMQRYRRHAILILAIAAAIITPPDVFSMILVLLPLLGLYQLSIAIARRVESKRLVNAGKE